MQTNLFQESKKIVINEEWDKYLYMIYPRLNHVLDRIDRYRKAGVHICPQKGEEFTVFHAVKPDKINVVILGQDPYPNANANGIAFSCQVKESPSLRSIKKAIKTNYPDGQKEDEENLFFNFYSADTLSHLLIQGVFLLNTVLTVNVGQPGSHRNIGWEPFTDFVIETIAREFKDVIWMLWGADARSYSRVIQAQNPDAYIFEDEHPAAAKHRGGVWKTNCFKNVNEKLYELGKQPIVWM